MRKLKLKLEDLSVTPFVAGEERTLRGTVDGYDSKGNCTGHVTAVGADNNCYPIYTPTVPDVPPDDTYDYWCTLGETC